MTVTDICNLALSRCGMNTVADLDERSREAEECRRWFDVCRRGVLRAVDWNFARGVAKLQLLDASVPNWGFVYAPPQWSLRLLRVFLDCEGLNARDLDSPYTGFYYDSYKWMVEQFRSVEYFPFVYMGQPAIGCNFRDAWCEFIQDSDKAYLFDALFVEALSIKLAKELVSPLSGRPELAPSLLQEYMFKLQEAQAVNGFEGKSSVARSSSYARARG